MPTDTHIWTCATCRHEVVSEDAPTGGPCAMCTDGLAPVDCPGCSATAHRLVDKHGDKWDTCLSCDLVHVTERDHSAPTIVYRLPVDDDAREDYRRRDRG